MRRLRPAEAEREAAEGATTATTRRMITYLDRLARVPTLVVICSPEELHVLQTGGAPPGATPVGKAALEMIERIRQAQGQYLRDGIGVQIEIRVGNEYQSEKVAESR